MLQFFYPTAIGLSQSFFDSVHDRSIGDFYLSIRLWMSHRCEILLNSLFFTPFFEGIVGELFAIITYDGMRYSESADDILPEELDDVFSRDY